MHRNNEGQLLYAACCIFTKRNGMKEPRTYFLHAANQKEARLSFCRQYPNRKTHHILEIGPALGFFAAGVDKTKEVVREKFSAA